MKGAIYIMLITISALFALNLNFHQTRFSIKFEKAFIKSYNTKYVKRATAVSFKYNRTDIALNTSLVFAIDTSDQLKVVIQTYKFTSNEYRMFPIKMEGYVCDYFNADVGGLASVAKQYGNIKNCSFVKDKEYYAYNLVFDSTKFPPNLPKGRYMLRMHFSFNSIEWWVEEFYVAVVYPEV